MSFAGMDNSLKIWAVLTEIKHYVQTRSITTYDAETKNVIQNLLREHGLFRGPFENSIFGTLGLSRNCDTCFFHPEWDTIYCIGCRTTFWTTLFEQWRSENV